MPARLDHEGRRREGGLSRLRRVARGAFAIAILTAFVPAAVRAECPPLREPRLPPAEEPVNNLDKHKAQLREYHDEGNYYADVTLVFTDASRYVAQRADQVARPAVILDIDETSLSNWPTMRANNFGYIKGGGCFEEPDLPCGFDAWIAKASATALPGSVEFFRTAVAKRVAVFFVTGRRHSQRQATLWNLDRAGFEGWAGLRTRPDDDHDSSIVPFKSGERKKIQDAHNIIANVGDQQSDLDGGHAECPFKVPNPFYFIK